MHFPQQIHKDIRISPSCCNLFGRGSIPWPRGWRLREGLWTPQTPQITPCEGPIPSYEASGAVLGNFWVRRFSLSHIHQTEGETSFLLTVARVDQLALGCSWHFACYSCPVLVYIGDCTQVSVWVAHRSVFGTASLQCVFQVQAEALPDSLTRDPPKWLSPHQLMWTVDKTWKTLMKSKIYSIQSCV